MNINFNDILEFYELRIACHVKSVNYFAGLLGYHFPEHDNNKTDEPIRTGYAFVFYNTYHPDFFLTKEMLDLCEDAKNNHHNHTSHHIQYYEHVSEIPDIRIYEMVSDWASANFEQMNILHEPDAVPIQTWFEKTMANKGWTEHQLEIIKKSFEIFDKSTDEATVRKIWEPLLQRADLD